MCNNKLPEVHIVHYAVICCANSKPFITFDIGISDGDTDISVGLTELVSLAALRESIRIGICVFSCNASINALPSVSVKEASKMIKSNFFLESSIIA